MQVYLLFHTVYFVHLTSLYTFTLDRLGDREGRMISSKEDTGEMVGDLGSSSPHWIFLGDLGQVSQSLMFKGV